LSIAVRIRTHPTCSGLGASSPESPYIDPDICIDCGACEPVCPVQAIRQDSDVPDEWKPFIQINAEYYKR
jgi:NAD-dependent dihydropyrimidine dehydrogenase PreA subunit